MGREDDAADAAAEIRFVLETIETSKDSNWRRTSVSVSGRKVTIHRESGGPFPPEDEVADRELDEEGGARLLHFLRDKGLAADVSVKEKAGSPGLFGRLEVEVRGAAPSHFVVEAVLDTPGVAEGSRANLEWFHGAEAFLRLVDRLVVTRP